MRVLRALGAVVALAMVLMGPTAAFADAKDAVLNKEGFWGIDVDHGACAASMTLQGGAIFLLRAQKGHVTFGLFGKRPFPRGKAGRIETEAYSFDFAPSYGEDASTLYFEGAFDARALAALRLAKQVRIVTDGQTVAAMTFEGTGFEGALDGVIACSNGQKGWWGKGVGAEGARTDNGLAPVTSGDQRARSKEGIWDVVSQGKSCFANASLKAGGFFMLKADAGELSFGVGLDHPGAQGRAGSFEIDGEAFSFEPSYSKDGVLFFRGHFNAKALAALRSAADVRVTVDGREVMQTHVAGTGLDGVMDAVLACSKGQAGWWGPGVEKTADTGASPHKQDFAPVMNKEGDWELGATSVAGICVGQAKVDDHVVLQIVGASGQLAVGVGSDKGLPRGRKGHVQTDSYAFDFTPDYNGDDFMTSRDVLDSQAAFALRRAKWIRVSVDGRQLLDADVTDTGFPELLDSAAACSRGEAGWWGKGAKPAA